MTRQANLDPVSTYSATVTMHHCLGELRNGAHHRLRARIDDHVTYETAIPILSIDTGNALEIGEELNPVPKSSIGANWRADLRAAAP